MNRGRPWEDKWDYCQSIRSNRVITHGWLSGFLDGEGSFYVDLGSNDKFRFQPE
jgi:hypothetical protein